jgi:hypothetical protein
MPDARLLAGAAALLGAGAVGLGVPAPTPKVQKTSGILEFTEADPAWPEGLHRWLDAAHGGAVPVARTACIVGNGRVRLGPSPWLPVSYRTSHNLGYDFAAELTATWYRRSVIRAVDGYLAGRGVTSVRGQTTMGAGLDQGEVPYLWSEAILFPATWFLPGLRFKQRSETELELNIGEGLDVASPLTATITLDPETGLPNSFAVPWRAQDPAGTRGAGWRVELNEWQPDERGQSVRLAQVSWADEARPWLRLRLDPPILDLKVTDEMSEIHTLQANWTKSDMNRDTD